MIPRLTRDQDGAPAPRNPDLVDGWLSVFLGLLPLPSDQAAGIREELEGHLRERIRDLMVTGTAEGDATRQAISELGEAADVAARYRALKTDPRRRLLMHVMVFTAVGAALALSVAALTGTKSPRPDSLAGADDRETLLAHTLQESVKVKEDLLREAIARADEREALLRTRLDQIAAAGPIPDPSAFRPEPPEIQATVMNVDFKATPLADVLQFFGSAAQLPVTVNWNKISAAGALEPKTPITLTAKETSLAALLRLINEGTELRGGDLLDCRVTGGTLEFSTRAAFDRREQELISYDLSGVIAARMRTYKEERGPVVEGITSLITSLVSPDDWRANGGDLAQLFVVGDRMFIEGPARLQPQITWIIQQLPTTLEAPAGPRSEGNPYRRLPILGNYFQDAQQPRGTQVAVAPVPESEALKRAREADDRIRDLLTRIDTLQFELDKLEASAANPSISVDEQISLKVKTDDLRRLLQSQKKRLDMTRAEAADLASRAKEPGR